MPQAALAADAGGIIEELRKGIPPPGYVRMFTVGRRSEIATLQDTLDRATEHVGAALLVGANYGAGKSHLLHLVREMALADRYAVALVDIDACNGVRFNRMDQIAGRVLRSLEVEERGRRGVQELFDLYLGVDESVLPPDVIEGRGNVNSGYGSWSFELKSFEFYFALRAGRLWGASSSRAQVERLCSPPPRFRQSGYRESWDVLGDIHRLAQLSGLRGLVLLFDEFEDVIQNTNRIDLEQVALSNLFKFFEGRRFRGMSYFAVTPDFIHKCRNRLHQKSVYDFPTRTFDELPRFEIRPITRSQLAALARRIRQVHGLAYDWDADAEVSDQSLGEVVDRVFSVQRPDRVRYGIKSVVSYLDVVCEGSGAS